MQVNFRKLIDILTEHKIDDRLIDEIVPIYSNIQIQYVNGITVLVYQSIMFENEKTIGELRKARFLSGIPIFIYLNKRDSELLITNYPMLGKCLSFNTNPNIAKFRQPNPKSKCHPAFRNLPK